MAESEVAKVAAALRGAETVALACHVDPDGDALGSMLALALALRRMGVTVHAGWGRGGAGTAEGPQPVPPSYDFLPGLELLSGPEEFPENPDVFIALDTGAPSRLGSLAAVARGASTVVVLDHHASGEAFGDLRMVDPDAPATVVLVVELLDELGVELDRDLATLLWVGLVTDTGRFSFAGTTGDTLRLGARLLDVGFDHVAVTQHVLDTNPFAYLSVLGGVLSRARLAAAGALVWSTLSQDDLEDAKLDVSEVEGLVDVLRTVDTAEVALLLKEQRDGFWKASMRGRGRIDVGEIAAAKGGGGHRNAAGFTVPGGPEELAGTVAAAVEAAS